MPKNKQSNFPSIGTVINRGINYATAPRRFVNNIINTLGVKSGNEFTRGLASMVTTLNGGLQDATRARINSAINEKFPGWIEEKSSDKVGKGQPVWTVDKEFGIARYYDSNGKLLISSPVGVGLVQGDKRVEGDNKTPEGTYRLSAPEKGANKKGGEFSFGPYFYRTNHTNDNGNSSGVGLHGTGLPLLNGTCVSHGCMRIDNNDIRKFHKIAPNRGAGTKIIISK